MRAVLMRFMLRSLLSKILHAIFISQKDANGDRPRGLHRLRVLCVLRVRKMPHAENAESAEVKCKMGNTCRAVGVDSGKMPRHQPVGPLNSQFQSVKTRMHPYLVGSDFGIIPVTKGNLNETD